MRPKAVTDAEERRASDTPHARPTWVDTPHDHVVSASEMIKAAGLESREMIDAAKVLKRLRDSTGVSHERARLTVVIKHLAALIAEDELGFQIEDDRA